MSRELKNISEETQAGVSASSIPSLEANLPLSAGSLSRPSKDILPNPDPVRIPHGFLEAQRLIRISLQSHLKSVMPSAERQAWLLSDKTHNLDLLDKLPILSAAVR